MKPNPSGKYRPEWAGGQQAFSASGLMGQRPGDLAFAHCLCEALACLRQTGGMDTIRTYRPEDSGACLEMFDGDVAAFFSADERPDFVRVLTLHAATTEAHPRTAACPGARMLRSRGDFTQVGHPLLEAHGNSIAMQIGSAGVRPGSERGLKIFVSDADRRPAPT